MVLHIPMEAKFTIMQNDEIHYIYVQVMVHEGQLHQVIHIILIGPIQQQAQAQLDEVIVQILQFTYMHQII